MSHTSTSSVLVLALVLGVATTSYVPRATACTYILVVPEAPLVTAAPRGGVWWVPRDSIDTTAPLVLASSDEDDPLAVSVVHDGPYAVGIAVPRDARPGSQWQLPYSSWQSELGALVVTEAEPVAEDLPPPELRLSLEELAEIRWGEPSCGEMGPYQATIAFRAHLLAEEVGGEIPIGRLLLDQWVAPTDAVNPLSDLFRLHDAVVPVEEEGGGVPPLLREEGALLHARGNDEAMLVSARFIDVLTGRASDIEQVVVDFPAERKEPAFACAASAGQHSAAPVWALLGLTLLSGLRLARRRALAAKGRL